jgi:transposase-like protein
VVFSEVCAKCRDWGASLSPDSCVSQLLQGSDVELHPPDEGEEIEEELHSRVQAGRRSAGRHTGQKRPAQVCREYGLAESVLLRWRREYGAQAKRLSPRSSSLTHRSSGERKIAELERFCGFCGKLALENEILKRGWRDTARAEVRHDR